MLKRAASVLAIAILRLVSWRGSIGVHGLRYKLGSGTFNGLELSIDHSVKLVRPPANNHPENEESQKAEPHSSEESVNFLANLLLLFSAHRIIHLLIFCVSVLSLLGLAAEVSSKASKCARAIVVPPLVVVRQHFIGFIDLLELGLMAFVMIGVVFLGELVVGLLEFGARGFFADHQDEIVVLVGVEFGRVEQVAFLSVEQATLQTFCCPFEHL